MSRVDPGDALLTEPERLDRPGALDGLGERGVDDRRTTRSPAGSRPWRARRYQRSADHQQRHAERRSGSEHPPADQDRADERARTVVISAIIHSGSAQRTDQPSCSTSREVRVSRSPVPALSTVPIGRASELLDEVLAQLGQHLLAEREREEPCPAGSAASAASRNTDQHQRSPCPRGRSWCPCRPPATRPPSSRGAGQPGDRGQQRAGSASMANARGCRRNRLRT